MKIKRHSSSAKRFKVTGSGRIRMRRSNVGHNTRIRGKKRMKRLHQYKDIPTGLNEKVERLLGLK
ncbi:large subunit ribosomal protein L35 [Marinitoga hydrogenitolerans DSM 16785]|uniref:Large subunit ribosomal protein L35 n=1 Tax=Marinitoga hydrogenitolerans (strain DSM 16785 / JCM 12826 / AT1271) TaxID=1122195 RepID=A0A1M4TZ71_MARH1|nr:50S ribosomal protein L35 [Marinitoga hydrogenitolerans]SHE49720.1 large subunit ribosomal protein L35 [Marinitoga hydrogenitolerans DSM 16785]